MSKNEWKRLVGVAGRMLLAFVFVFSQTAWAGQDQKAKDNAGAPQKAAASQTGEKQSAATTAKAQNKQAQGEESESSVVEERSNGPSHQGVKVHGNWTIEVRNPDGSLATHREFENSYITSIGGGADGALPLFLGRQYSVGQWAVLLVGTICGDSAHPTVCSVQEPGYPTNPSCCFNTLTLGLPSSGANAGKLVLAGNVTALLSGNIIGVQTTVTTCPFASAGCAFVNNSTGTNSVSFTSFDLTSPPSTPVAVSAGQIVQVQVVVSFS